MVKSTPILQNPSANNGGIFYYRLLLVLSFFVYSHTLFSQAKLTIKDPKTNFGFVQRGTVVKTNYEITNTGNAPLILTDAEVACSCTSVDFPKQPILPGQKAIVVVSFNTTTVFGRQDRIVLLQSNDPSGPHQLRYKGTVSRH